MLVPKVFFCLVSVFSVLSFGARDVLAHSFNVGFLLPMTGADVIAGKQALNGFRFAAGERDAHPDEEADGHLGGLDVYILEIDSNLNSDELLSKVRQLIGRKEINFITGYAASEKVEMVRRELSDSNVVFIGAAGKTSMTLKTMDGEPFDIAYSQRFGTKLLPSASRGYAQARRIDLIVRALNGDFSNSNHVKDMVRQLKN